MVKVKVFHVSHALPLVVHDHGCHIEEVVNQWFIDSGVTKNSIIDILSQTEFSRLTSGDEPHHMYHILKIFYDE